MTIHFAAVHESGFGTSRYFAAARQSRCFRAEADIGLDFMSTRPSIPLLGLKRT